jgi:cytochrome c-type biogenesis protein CcsB
MKKILSLISSTRFMATLLFFFALSIACATFIEKNYGTDAARKIVYNARWFEILMILGAINIVAVAIQRKVYRREKLTLFIFHLAFVLIIIGAGITRYFGKEGFIRLREGETSRTWYSSNTHIGFIAKDQNTVISKSYPVLFSSVSKNRFNRTSRLNDHKIRVELTDFLPKAEKFISHDNDGQPMIQLVTNIGAGRKEIILAQNQRIQLGHFILSYVSVDSIKSDLNKIYFFSEDDTLHFIASSTVISMDMSGESKQSFEAGQTHPLNLGALYKLDDIPFVIKQFEPSGKIDVRTLPPESEVFATALRINVSCDGVTKNLSLIGNKSDIGQFTYVTFNKVKIGLNYGALQRQLPFELTLNDFILNRYPGSKSPSWYESQLQLTDNQRGVKSQSRVYMNHILKHRGYRFYQSSYDEDEKGTILAVNRDGAGSFVTYLGYLLMTIGMLLSLVNRNSRFLSGSGADSIQRSIKTIGILLLFIILNTIPTFANDSTSIRLPEINREYAQKFGQILVQDNGGRIEPLNSLASEVLRKVSRKESYEGQTPDQVLLGMLVYPEQWQLEPMIRINHPGLQKILELDTKYAAFDNFFSKDRYRTYILQPYVEEAYRKEPAYRSKFENEIIRTDERLNVCYLVYTGTLLRLFPAPNDSTNTWYSSSEAGGFFVGEDSIFTKHILQFCFDEIRNSMSTGNWKASEELVQAINLFQKYHGADVMPSDNHIKAESFYNKADLFVRVTRIYLLAGIVLLLLQFIHIFIPRFRLKWFFAVAFVFIVVAFTTHTFGLGLRWYISGHAPWSNGYEALTFIAWATVLAGLIFSRKAGIALSSTAILAALILQTAHLSWMDPQVTNLVPVLKSYWLVVHVAVITASYGFLGLAALVAAINLLLMGLQTKKNYDLIDKQILQINRVIEMSMIAGLYLLSIGTFLGGVWANESWGRYWGWDPKETWALVTVIVYAFILHLRLIPGLNGRILFNSLALAGFASVIMTYFGVNYYLSGLHSYASGNSLPVPPIVYWSVAIFFLLSGVAFLNQLRMQNKNLSKSSETVN